MSSLTVTVTALLTSRNTDVIVKRHQELGCPAPTCLPGQGGSQKRMRPKGNQAGVDQPSRCGGFFLGGFIPTCRAQTCAVADTLSDRVLAWAVFLEWLMKALNQYKVAPRQLKRLLDHTLSGVMDDVKDDMQRDLNKRLPGVTQDGWGMLASGDDELDFEALVLRQSI